MPCFHPLRAYRASKPNSSGKYPVVFNFQAGYSDQPISLPCGQCIGCRLDRSRQWALRCIHESKLYDDNCFITLTYSDEHLPADRSLNVRDWQLFAKRLRKFSVATRGRGFRFFHCGEYGEQYGRPHYHACLFDFDFADKVYKRSNRNGDRIYTSETLQELWPYGQSEIGSVTFQSAAYVARYIVKKITGDSSEQYYWFVDDDGVVHDRRPEYTTMSRRPGIGKGWIERFSSDVFPHGYVIHDGKRHKVPRFYDSHFELLDYDLPSKLALSPLKKVKAARKRSAAKHAADNTPERRAVREEVQLVRMQSLKRELK